MVELTPSDRPVLTSLDLSDAEALLALAERTAEMLAEMPGHDLERRSYGAAIIRGYVRDARSLLAERKAARKDHA